MGKLDVEEIELAGRKTTHLEDDEYAIPDYDCNMQSVSEAVRKLNGANWKLKAFYYNVLNNCDIVDFGVAGAMPSDSESEPQTRLGKMNTPPKKAKKKRKMSAYNCYVRKETSSGKSLQEVAPAYKNLSESEKARYKQMAEDGC